MSKAISEGRGGAILGAARVASVRGFLRRRHYLIHRELQLGLLASSLGEVFFFALVVGLAVFLPPATHILRDDAHSSEALKAATQILHLHASFWPAAVLAVVAVTLHSIYSTHRVAGPIWRFSKIIQSLQDGVFPKPSNLRRGDRLQREMARFNAMLTANRARITRLRDAQTRLSDAIVKLESAGPDADRTTLTELIADAVREGKHVDEAAAEFVVET